MGPGLKGRIIKGRQLDLFVFWQVVVAVKSTKRDHWAAADRPGR